MSESEKRKRNGYIRNRDKWIFAHTVIVIVVAVAVLISALVANRLEKTYYIGYTESGHIDYNVSLKENDFYDTAILGKDQAYVASLIDQIFVGFNYKISMDTDDVHYRYSYTIKSRLEILDGTTDMPLFKPEKVLFSEQNKTQSSQNTLIIDKLSPLDYDEYNDLANQFVETYGLTSTESNIVVTLEVDVLSDCNSFTGSATENYISELRIPLTTKTVNIEMTSTVPEPDAKMIACVRGVAGEVFKTTAVVLAVIDVLLILLLVAFIALTKTPDVTYAGRVKKYLSQYKSYIQKIHNPFDTDGYQVLSVDSFEEMLEIRDTIQAPVLMYENEDKTCAKFYIPTEGKLLYLYEIKVEGYVDPPKPKKEPEPTTIVKPQITNVVKPVVKVVMPPPAEPAPPPAEPVPPPPAPDPEPEIKTVVEDAEIEVEGAEDENPVIVVIVEPEDEDSSVDESLLAAAAVAAVEDEDEAYIEIISESEEPAAEPEAVTEEPAVEVTVEEILESIPEVVEPQPVKEPPKHIVVVPAWDDAVKDYVASEAEVATGEYKIELNPPITKAIYAVKRKAIKVFTALITPDEEEIDEDMTGV